MKMEKHMSALIFIVVVFLLGSIFLYVGNHLLNRYSVPQKQERLDNLKAEYSITDLNELDPSLISGEIDAALSKYTNWDNLFLSEHFKEKYKSRKNILEDADNIANISSGLDSEYGNDVVIIFAEKKSSIFDTDESDNITTEYYFRYVLNEAGEIDDLILLKKTDTYTLSGEPVDENEKLQGWQE